MAVQLEFRPYRRSFRRPLQTHHGTWTVREGILLRLTNAQRGVGWGEIAPLDWFGSETLADALQLCRELPADLDAAAIAAIPDTRPACQMGLGAAWENLQSSANEIECSAQTLPRCSLLPSGPAALKTWPTLWQRGDRSFKTKIGMAALPDEQRWIEQLVRSLPSGTKLRLDANGGLTLEEAQSWLDWCDRTGIEFLEQPLPAQQIEAMIALAQDYRTPIALDESVATVQQMDIAYQQGWRGIFVVKAAIAGSPQKLQQFCQTHPVKLVFSTVFETVIGQQTALNLAADLNAPELAIGFGVRHWFNDDWDTFTPEQLWQHLGTC